MEAPIQVVEIMKDWGFSRSFEGTNGIRRFISASALPRQTPMDLPIISSPFNPDWPLVTLKQIDCGYLEDRPTCPIIYVCRYDSRPMWSSDGITTPRPVTSSSVGADYLTYTNPSSVSGTGQITLWKWLTAPATYVDAPDIIIPKLEYSETITKVRYVCSGSTLEPWYNATRLLVGGINDAPLSSLDNIPRGFLLYLGSDLTEMSNENNNHMWRAEMRFRYRIVWNDTDVPIERLDWTYVFNAQLAKYQQLVVPGTPDRYLYTFVDFTPLLTSCLPPITMGTNLPLGGLPRLTPAAPAP
jgi:hypothetical protein